MGLPFHEGLYRPQEFHVLSGPGLRSGDHSFGPNFDPELLDLVVEVPKSQSESVTEFELPLLFDQRPHEDPILEAWLGKTLDNPDKAMVVLEARCLQKLQQAVEDQPEVCPVLRNLLSRFEASIAQWLSSWPHAEPLREGLTVASCSKQSAEMLELELHSVLALQGGMAPGPQQPPFLAESEETLDAFRQEAAAWLFKLEALYGLELINQPERMVQHPRLSMLCWELPEVEALLQCPYFRPPEMSVWRFARRWCLEGGGACAFRDEPEAGVPTVTKENIDMAISKGLIWELLPPKEELVARSGGESDAQSQSCWDWRGRAQSRRKMAGAQSSEVDAVLKGFLTDFPSIIGFVVINADGIPTKWHETMPYDRAVMYAALMSDFIAHCKKSLRGLLTSPAESELANIRLRTKQGTEIICVTQVEYTLVVIQNCTGVPLVDEEANQPGAGGEGS
eukprot:s361_g1.t2